MYRLFSTMLLSTFCFAGSVLGQAVQLPTFDIFGVNTTVSVPDRGSALLGGVTRSSSGVDSRGVPMLGRIPGVGRLFRNQAIGREDSSGQAHVTARIIDLHEMDEAVLQEAASQSLSYRSPNAGRSSMVAAPNVTHQQAAALTANLSSDAAPAASVEAIRQQRALVQHERAMKLIREGQVAESKGLNGMAKGFYKAALEHAGDRLAQHIHNHLYEMATAEQANVIAASTP